MKRSPKLLLGLVTVWPISYMALFLGFMAYQMFTMVRASGASPGSADSFVRHFEIVFVLHLGTMLVTAALITTYVVHLFRSPRVAQDRRVLWLIVLLMGAPVAMPIYWYLFIWREPLAARPAAPERARGLPGGGAPTEQAEMRTSTAAVAGLVCSIPGVVCCPIGIVGLILGILALAEIAKVPALRGKTIAIIAIVLGGFSIPVTGIVAATAVPLSLRYLRRAKTAEATENVAYLYRAVVRTYDGSRQLPQSLPRTPATPPCGDVQMWPADAAPGWRALGFTPTEPLRYSYEYVSDGHAFTVRALGDLDGDGLSSTFERAGTIQAGEVVGSPRLSVIREVE